jgi:hypothetical protein
MFMSSGLRFIAAAIAAGIIVNVGVVASVHGQAPFFWNRTGQTKFQATTATVSVTVNGGATTDGPRTDSSTTDDLVSADATESDSDPSPGGGGGDGGSGARPAGNGDDGIDGADGSSLDGDDGPDFDTAGGLGGDDGADGEAEASGQTVGELELNPDDQEVLSWTFIHNQAADLDLTGGGGGGGGGAGANGPVFLAGNGGDGGDGEDADGRVVATQTSSVNVTAVLQRQPMSMLMPTTGRFTVDIGWTSTATATLENGGPAGNPWNRTCGIVMTHSDGASMTIAPGNGNLLYATGSVPGQCPFVASSNAALDDVTGELIVDIDDFEFPVSLNSTATIVANGAMGTGSNPVLSTLTGNMSADPGEGGLGGNSSDPAAGVSGEDGGDGDGPEGGLGGEGMGDGGDGGEGGDGDEIVAHEDGIFQGVVQVWVDD